MVNSTRIKRLTDYEGLSVKFINELPDATDEEVNTKMDALANSKLEFLKSLSKPFTKVSG